MNRVSLSLLLFAGCGAFAAERNHDITVEDYFTQARIGDCRVAPDGRHAVYVESRWRDAGDERGSELWTVALPSGKIRRLTFAAGGNLFFEPAPKVDVIAGLSWELVVPLNVDLAIEHRLALQLRTVF